MSDPNAKLHLDLGKAFSDRKHNLRAIAKRAGDSDAEDVVQDAFLRIVEASQKQEIRKVDNLLSRIVRFVAIERIRRRYSQPALVSSRAGEEFVDTASDPERSLMGAQRLQRVMETINGMPPKRREVFLLHRVEELTYPQIARKLGVSIKAVEKHMHLAMVQLSDADD